MRPAVAKAAAKFSRQQVRQDSPAAAAAHHRSHPSCQPCSLAAPLLLFLLVTSSGSWGGPCGAGAIRVRGLGQHEATVPAAHLPGTALPRAAPQQWLADPDKGQLLTILVPVFPDAYTLALLANQLRTFAQFLQMETILEILFVCPRDQLEKLVTFLEGWLNQLPEIAGDQVKVISDEVCAPELSQEGLMALAPDAAQYLAGWHKQQLIKLACAWVIKTPFYLILDADVFFLWPISAAKLLEAAPIDASQSAQPCAVCDLQQTTRYRALNEIMWVDHNQTGWSEEQVKQAQWAIKSAEMLGIPFPDISHHQHLGVTPQTFATPVVLAMAQYIEEELSADRGAPNGRDNWRQHLLRSIFDIFWSDAGPAWTEYETYWAFAHHFGLWDQYHAQGHLWRGPANVWDEEGFKGWDPCRKVQEPDYPPGYEGYPGLWAVVQSRLQIPADDIWAKLQVCLESEKAAVATAGM